MARRSSTMTNTQVLAKLDEVSKKPGNDRCAECGIEGKPEKETGSTSVVRHVDYAHLAPSDTPGELVLHFARRAYKRKSRSKIGNESINVNLEQYILILNFMIIRDASAPVRVFSASLSSAFL